MRYHIRSLLLAAPLLAACGQAPLASGATLNSGPASLERRVNVAFGGYSWWIEVDSTSASLSVKCEQVTGSRVGNPCANYPARTVSLAPTDVRSLFSLTRQQDFVNAKAEYDMSATFVDGPSYSIALVANGVSKQVRWSDAERALPSSLRAVSDRMLSLAGLTP